MIGSRHTILLVDEDAPTRAFLACNLAEDGYEVLLADGRRHALALLAARRPALVLVDINGDTLELLDAVRAGDGVAGRADPDTPVIVLTSRGDELASVRVFEHHGDDVVRKPFSYPELRGRIRAVLRRAYGHGRREVARVGTLTVDAGTREVHVGEQRVQLSAKEFELLRALASDPTRVFTKQELLRDVWGYRSPGRTRTVDSHACRLRQKLLAAGANRRLVINVWGVGLRLCDRVPAELAA